MQIWVPIHVNHCNENWFQPARSDFAVFLSLFLYFSVWVICRHVSSFPGISGWREQIAGVLGVGACTERGKADGRPAGLGGLLMALASSTSLFGLILCRGSTWWRGALGLESGCGCVTRGSGFLRACGIDTATVPCHVCFSNLSTHFLTPSGGTFGYSKTIPSEVVSELFNW